MLLVKKLDMAVFFDGHDFQNFEFFSVGAKTTQEYILTDFID